jgi:hypothetical protein
MLVQLNCRVSAPELPIVVFLNCRVIVLELPRLSVSKLLA